MYSERDPHRRLVRSARFRGKENEGPGFDTLSGRRISRTCRVVKPRVRSEARPTILHRVIAFEKHGFVPLLDNIDPGPIVRR